MLCSLGRKVDKPWLVFGDFNKVLHNFEKWGGQARPEKLMNDFCEVLTACDLRDLGYEGTQFTWCNNRQGEGRIFERLDRFLVNSKWCDFFPFESVSHGQVAYSDHCPIWFNTHGNRIRKRGTRLFRFFFLISKLDCLDLRLCGQRMRIALTLLRLFGKQGVSLGQ